jgi:hypothetical protein
MGPTDFLNFDVYGGGFTGPTSFGSGVAAASADTGSGDLVGIGVLSGIIFVPQGYVSGSALSSSATWNNAFPPPTTASAA